MLKVTSFNFIQNFILFYIPKTVYLYIFWQIFVRQISCKKHLVDLILSRSCTTLCPTLRSVDFCALQFQLGNNGRIKYNTNIL